MVVKLRLARNLLTRNNPSYKIVAIPSTLRVTALPLETLGSYAPIPVVSPPPSLSPNGALRGAEWGARQMPREGPVQQCGDKVVEWNETRIRYWLQQGALPSKRVERLLISAGILSPSSFFLPPSLGCPHRMPVMCETADLEGMFRNEHTAARDRLQGTRHVEAAKDQGGSSGHGGQCGLQAQEASRART